MWLTPADMDLSRFARHLCRHLRQLQKRPPQEEAPPIHYGARVVPSGYTSEECRRTLLVAGTITWGPHLHLHCCRLVDVDVDAA